MRLDPRPILAAVCLCLVIGACGKASAPAPAGRENATSIFQLPLPTTDRLLEIAHSGVRRVEVYAGGTSPVLAYRESIVVSGDGTHFSLEPIEALTPVPAEWIHREKLWARFAFLYRDFAVRAAGAFHRNWRLTDLAQEATVAGRAGRRYLVERLSGDPVRYDLVVDQDLGLVLEASKYDGRGRLVQRTVYESLSETVDLESAVWTESLISESALDPDGDLRAQVGAEVPVPLRIPERFELREAGTARYEDRDWLRLVYDDGVEPVFFLATWSATEPTSTGGSGEGGRAADRLLAGHLGGVNVVQTLHQGEILMGVGALGDDELADLVESALP